MIEAALEDVGLKQKIFADLEAACRPDAILSTNTSTIDISLVGAKTKAAERIVGAHFFSPAHIMPLLEIVRTPQTSKQARAPRHEMSLCQIHAVAARCCICGRQRSSNSSLCSSFRETAGHMLYTHRTHREVATYYSEACALI